MTEAFDLNSGEVLEHWPTAFAVIARPDPSAPGAVYVKGLRVADEANFLFSYNFTAPDAKLNRALDRERSNVGRTAYSDRVKDILKASTSIDVLGPLTRDIANLDKGEAMRDELRWKDVALYACRALQGVRKTMFVTAAQGPTATSSTPGPTASTSSSYPTTSPAPSTVWTTSRGDRWSRCGSTNSNVLPASSSTVCSRTDGPHRG